MLMGRVTVLSIALALFSACSAPETNDRPEGRPVSRPVRIVSLDYCADQFVLKLVDRDRILAVSPDADADFSYMRKAAAGLRVVRPVAEDALVLKPDLIVRSYGGGPNATAFFQRAGVPVLNVGWANDIDSVKRVIAELAEGLNEAARGEAVIAEMNARLDAIKANPRHQTALYMTPAGVTTGPGSLVHEMLVAANLENFQEAPGWRSIPLERLAYEQPDMVATAFFDTKTDHPYAWSAMAHPIARTQLRARPTVSLNGAWTACGGWFLMDAVEALAIGQEKGARDE